MKNIKTFKEFLYETFNSHDRPRPLDTSSLNRAEHEFVMDIIKREGSGKPMSLDKILSVLFDRVDDKKYKKDWDIIKSIVDKLETKTKFPPSYRDN